MKRKEGSVEEGTLKGSLDGSVVEGSPTKKEGSLHGRMQRSVEEGTLKSSLDGSVVDKEGLRKAGHLEGLDGWLNTGLVDERGVICGGWLAPWPNAGLCEGGLCKGGLF